MFNETCVVRVSPGEFCERLAGADTPWVLLHVRSQKRIPSVNELWRQLKRGERSSLHCTRRELEEVGFETATAVYLDVKDVDRYEDLQAYTAELNRNQVSQVANLAGAILAFDERQVGLLKVNLRPKSVRKVFNFAAYLKAEVLRVLEDGGLKGDARLRIKVADCVDSQLLRPGLVLPVGLFKSSRAIAFSHDDDRHHYQIALRTLVLVSGTLTFAYKGQQVSVRPLSEVDLLRFYETPFPAPAKLVQRAR
jgi:hypothetical protein